MKTLLVLVTSLAIAVGGAYAGCGKKVTDKGTLESYDKDSKTIVVKAGDKEVKVTLTSKTVIKDKDGKEVKIKDLDGKTIEVVSEHKKADSVTEKA